VTFEVGRWDGAGARRVAARSRWSFAGLLLTVALSGAAAQEATPGRAFSVTNDQTLYPLRDVGGGVFVVQGDSGQGAEGRPNAGFVETDDGIVVVGGLASPAQARAVIRTIRTRSERPIRWLVLYAHHPDTRVLAAEGGPDAMVANWHSVVGLQELLGFEYADQPDWPVTGWDTLRLGGEELVVIHPGPAHSAGDLMFWLPGRRVLFSGDILVEDGITMVVDGNSQVLLATLALIDSLAPKVLVPGHGRIPEDPAQLVALTRGYITALRDSMRAEVRRGTSMRRAVEAFPPPDPARPVSPDSRIRRNAVRVFLEMEREAFGLDEEDRP
jgi:glyoxylase-like metal-dependent hydrolase (beta-lactamase superfamily II)